MTPTKFGQQHQTADVKASLAMAARSALADGLLEPSLKPEQVMAFFNRLRDAVRHATAATSDAVGASPPAVPEKAQARRRARMLARRGRKS